MDCPINAADLLLMYQITPMTETTEQINPPVRCIGLLLSSMSAGYTHRAKKSQASCCIPEADTMPISTQFRNMEEMATHEAAKIVFPPVSQLLQSTFI